MLRSKFLSVCLFVFIGVHVSAQTPRSITKLMNEPFMKGSSFSLQVEEVKSGRLVYSYNPDLQLIPASVMKVVTTATALELLGSEYHYRTSLEYDGTIADGVLKGNLYIKGSGDPSLGSSFIRGTKNFINDWVDAVKNAGITKIEGSIISDERIFDNEGISVKWLREDLGNYYAAGSYGVSVFDNRYTLTLRSGAIGMQPEILKCSPDMPNIRFHNDLHVIDQYTDSAFIVGSPFDYERSLIGALPAYDSSYLLKGDIPDPPLYLATYLDKRLKREGIDILSSPSSFRLEKAAGRLEKSTEHWEESERHPLITTDSPALETIVSVANHVSHNLYADAMLKTLGLRYPSDSRALTSFERGVREIKDCWQSRGISASSLWMYDGCGLAPTDKVSTKFMTALLVYMAKTSAESKAFIASLPMAGEEGSVRSFLDGTKLQGKARFKSGSMSRVRNFAGYIMKNGKTYAVSVFANNYSCTTKQMTNAIENLFVQLFPN